MDAEVLMPCKLTILYILDRVDFPLPSIKLTDFMTSSDFADYFSVRQSLSDLAEDKFINKTTMNGTVCYKITGEGGETLSFFIERIPKSVREKIDRYMKENKYRLKNEANILTDIYPSEHNDYIVRLRVMERGVALVDINLVAATENEAKLICSNWKKKSSDIYSNLFTALISDD